MKDPAAAILKVPQGSSRRSVANFEIKERSNPAGTKEKIYRRLLTQLNKEFIEKL